LLIVAFLGASSTAAVADTRPSIPTDGSIADVAERVVESVVNIDIESEVPTDQFFVDMFGADESQKMSGKGSGVIITANGRILTNAHVVNGADTIKVTLADGTEYSAKVVGVDKRSDLAVVQLEGNVPRLKAISFGDSSQLRLAEPVLAIGDPFGVGQTVTMGIVSAKGRASVGIEDYEDFIQTDAAINPGNSGGALINLRGELVGINTAILSRSGGYQGVGFAIPSNMAKPIMDALVKDGKVSRGYLGIGLVDLNRELAEANKISAIRGVVVTQVVPGSPAAKAGLSEKDVILAVDGAPVSDSGHLRNEIAMKGAGAKVELEVLRGKKTEKMTATLVDFPDQEQAVRAVPTRGHRAGR
jgi:Do/DeqQ family serine protease